jgi:hypothetical protein
LDLAEAQSTQLQNNTLKQQELLKINSFKEISRSNLVSARAKVKSLEVQQQTAAANVKRFDRLLKDRAVSQEIFEKNKQN